MPTRRILAVSAALIAVLLWLGLRAWSGEGAAATSVRPVGQEDGQVAGLGLGRSAPQPARALAPAGHTSGPLSYNGASIRGQVTDGEGHPIPAAEVSYASRGSDPPWFGYCESDEGGGYLIRGAPQGAGLLRCYAPGWLPARLEIDLAGDRGDQREDLLLVRPTGIPLVLCNPDGGAPWDGIRPNVRIRVTRAALPAVVPSRADFEPSAGRFVEFRPEPNTDVTASPVVGILRLDGETGYVHVTFGTAVLASRFVHRGSTGLRIVLPDGSLERCLASLSARFVWQEDGAPVPADATLVAESGGHRGVGLGADGVVHFEGLPPQRYELVLRAGGAERVRRSLTLAPGQQLDLGNLRSLSIGGEVSGPAGEQAAYSVVRLGHFLPEPGVVDWSAGTWTRCDSSGRFEFTSLPPGRYVLRCDRDERPGTVANLPTMGSAGVWIDLVDRDERTVSITLAPTVEVVVPAQTSSSGTVSLRIHDRSGYELVSAWTGTEPYSLYLVTGTYEVAWWSHQAEVARHPFTLGSDPVALPAPP